MGLIRDLQNDLLDPSIKLPNALRKAQVLAYRLGSDDLRTWTDGELNGYPTMDVPVYRRLHARPYGTFMNSVWKSSESAVPLSANSGKSSDQRY